MNSGRSQEESKHKPIAGPRSNGDGSTANPMKLGIVAVCNAILKRVATGKNSSPSAPKRNHRFLLLSNNLDSDPGSLLQSHQFSLTGEHYMRNVVVRFIFVSGLAILLAPKPRPGSHRRHYWPRHRSYRQRHRGRQSDSHRYAAGHAMAHCHEWRRRLQHSARSHRYLRHQSRKSRIPKRSAVEHHASAQPGGAPRFSIAGRQRVAVRRSDSGSACCRPNPPS